MSKDVSITPIIPLGEYILVECIQEETLTASGIVLPEATKEKPWSGKVIAIWNGWTSPDGKINPIENIQVGDIVFFAKYTPEEIEKDGKKYLLIKHSSIFAKQA